MLEKLNIIKYYIMIFIKIYMIIFYLINYIIIEIFILFSSSKDYFILLILINILNFNDFIINNYLENKWNLVSEYGLEIINYLKKFYYFFYKIIKFLYY